MIEVENDALDLHRRYSQEESSIYIVDVPFPSLIPFEVTFAMARGHLLT